ncbi:MAG TPA: ABC transporter substrate-binding protein [Bryobacteraceae bacterium]|jgi:peptide/nickel transport system substrate-binding protein|nr:ABC transporter substrate-binding protein [Bryobacteraceae bacterium]
MSKVRLLLLLVCIAFAGCSKAPAPEVRPHQGTTLSIGWPYLSGGDSLNGIQQAIGLLSYEGLVLIARDGRAQPRLAESWKESADGLTWVFQLRPNAFFHDGSRVDSAAVKASLTRTLSRAERDTYPGLLDIASLETPTPDQLVIRMKAHSTFLLEDLIVAIDKRVPVEPAAEEAPVSGAVKERRFGTGPYVTSSTSSTTPPEVVMQSFPSYYRGAPEIDRIVWKSYTTARTAWAAMMRGEIDFLYDVAPDALEFTKNEGSVQDFSFLKNYVHGAVFNSRRPVFRDPRVRRALNYAVDRSAIMDQVFKGHGLPASTPMWPQHWANDVNLPNYTYDPARAVALLEAAGLRINKSQGNPNLPPSRLRFTCILPTNIVSFEPLALMVQRNLSQIGVDMQLETLPLEELNRRVIAGEFDAVLLYAVAGNSAGRPYALWYSDSKQNYPGYQDEEVDQAFDRLRKATDDDATREAFHDLQARFLDDPPAIFLAFTETTRAVNRRFEPGVPPDTDPFKTISEWRLAGTPGPRDSN